MSILVVGSVGLDTLETPRGRRDEVLGGSACHFALAASVFGVPVRLVGIVGSDFPEDHVRLLDERGIDLAGLERVDGATFRWHGRYEDFGVAQSLATHLNVFESFDPAIPRSWLDSDIVFLGNIAPALQAKVLEQFSGTRLTVMDTMNFWISSQSDAVLELIGRVDVAIVNEQEARELTGCRHAVDAGRRLLERGARAVIVKKGEHGALLVGHDELFVCPSYPSPDIVDTTGAGDSFAGGFCGYLAHAGNLEPTTMRRAVVHGCILGSLNIEGFGTERTAAVTADDVAARLEAIRAMTTF